MTSPMIGARARMNGIDESSPTCRQPVTFFGVFPATWDLRAPNSRRRTERRRRPNVHVCRRNSTVDFERKKISNAAGGVNEKGGRRDHGGPAGNANARSTDPAHPP